MSEAEWMNIADRSLLVCAELLQKIDSVKEQLQRLQEDLKRIKDLLKDKQEREGYDAVYQHGSTSETHQTL